ncbi:hypothetical protein HA402_010467 [Bradysia odoriphaga]|nr:hypothetical protein HA402_010467 [Bradysia odoriphaga]
MNKKRRKVSFRIEHSKKKVIHKMDFNQALRILGGRRPQLRLHRIGHSGAAGAAVPAAVHPISGPAAASVPPNPGPAASAGAAPPNPGPAAAAVPPEPGTAVSVTIVEQNQNYELLQTNPIFYDRFLSILSSTNGKEKEKAGQSSVCLVVEILTKLPSDILSTLPPKLMDAVGILISSKSDESLVHRCKTLLVKLANVDDNVRLKCLSPAFFKFLSQSKDAEVLTVAVQILSSQSHLLKEEHGDILAKIKIQLDTRAFFNAPRLDPDLFIDFIKRISSLNLKRFRGC